MPKGYDSDSYQKQQVSDDDLHQVVVLERDLGLSDEEFQPKKSQPIKSSFLEEDKKSQDKKSRPTFKSFESREDKFTYKTTRQPTLESDDSQDQHKFKFKSNRQTYQNQESDDDQKGNYNQERAPFKSSESQDIGFKKIVKNQQESDEESDQNSKSPKKENTLIGFPENQEANPAKTTKTKTWPPKVSKQHLSEAEVDADDNTSEMSIEIAQVVSISSHEEDYVESVPETSPNHSEDLESIEASTQRSITPDESLNEEDVHVEIESPPMTPPKVDTEVEHERPPLARDNTEVGALQTPEEKEITDDW
uniref:Uncharacterized protein n=1 Tax=Panagrolaimus sp. JU765 TaxID=591449 RepID=A0AC34R3H6_9BILA